MTTSVDLDFVLIREKSIPDIARHIIQLLQNHRAIDVCYTLLDSVRSELLGPAVFDILLSATKSIDCITACLRQNHSIRIRKQAIKQYGKALADIDRWKEAWESMGSTRGILEYLSTISVDEAQTLCSRIGRCNIRTTKLAERAAVVQDLLQAIDPVSYPGGVHVTPEKRPLERFAALLIPSCSSEFLQNLMDNGVYKTLYRSLSISLALKSHESSILRYTVDMTLNNESKTTQNDVRQYLTRFVYNNPSTPSDEKYFSASMKFSETMLEERLKKPKMVWPYTPSESNIYFCLLRRCLKRRLTKQRLYSVMELGMRLLEFNPNLENQFVKHCALYWQRITIYWGLWPEYWEDLVIRGMQLGLEGSGQNISASFLRFVDNSKIKEDRTWDAFRLLCLHLPKGKIEIGTTKDLRLLDRQKWNLEVLEKLPADKAIRILQFLLSDKLNSDFLDQVPSYSILHLSRVGDQYNFNALLYQTMLQISMPDELQRSKGYQRAIEAYENLKGQSESSREQQDRALYAKAAGLFAIASGSLEFYGAHVKWLVRFVQDPLTVKVIFGRYAIASKEASNLLSGIPYPLPKTTTLSKISKNVSMANAILLQFHEHQKAAKRQPSYQDCDWNAWRTLLVSSITTRIDRAPILQNNINASQGELYSQLWSQTLALFSQIGFEYMNKVCYIAICLVLANHD